MIKPFSADELLEKMCSYSQTQWGDEHSPNGAKIYLNNGDTYIIKAGESGYFYTKDGVTQYVTDGKGDRTAS